MQRQALDFILFHFPINNNILDNEEKIALVRASLQLLIKNEYSMTRRLFAWLIGSSQEDEIDLEDPEIKSMMGLLIGALKLLFKIEGSTKEKLGSGLKIIDSLFKHQVKLVDFTLESVSIDIIKCVEDYWLNSAMKANDEIIIKLQKFFKDYDVSYLDCLWTSLGKLIQKANATENELSRTIEINETVRILRFCLANVKVNGFLQI